MLSSIIELFVRIDWAHEPLEAGHPNQMRSLSWRFSFAGTRDPLAKVDDHEEDFHS